MEESRKVANVLNGGVTFPFCVHCIGLFMDFGMLIITDDQIEASKVDEIEFPASNTTHPCVCSV